MSNIWSDAFLIVKKTTQFYRVFPFFCFFLQYYIRGGVYRIVIYEQLLTATDDVGGEVDDGDGES